MEGGESLAVEAGGGKKGVVSVEHMPFCVAGSDAMLQLLQKAQHLAVAGTDSRHRAAPLSTALAAPRKNSSRWSRRPWW